MLALIVKMTPLGINSLTFCQSIFVCFTVADYSCHCGKLERFDEDLTIIVVKQVSESIISKRLFVMCPSSNRSHLILRL